MTFPVINLGGQLLRSSILVTESEMFCSNHHKQVALQLYLHVNGTAAQRCSRQPEVTIKIPKGVYTISGSTLQMALKKTKCTNDACFNLP